MTYQGHNNTLLLSPCVNTCLKYISSLRELILTRSKRKIQPENEISRKKNSQKRELSLPLSSSLSLSLRRSYRLARGDAGGQTNASAGLATAEAGADGAGGDDAERPWKKLCFWMWRQVCMLPGRPADSTTPQSLFPEPQTLRFACCLSFFNRPPATYCGDGVIVCVMV